ALAAHAAAAAALAALAARAARAAAHAALAAHAAHAAAANDAVLDDVSAGIERDLRVLGREAGVRGWNPKKREKSASTPVPVSIFGELWPDGEPDWWTNDAEPERDKAPPAIEGEAKLRLRIPSLPIADTAEHRAEIKKQIRAIVLAADLVNRELGGPGLEIVSGHIRAPQSVRVGVPNGGSDG
ncbi:MAG: hypothetical protein AAFR38_01715, partial [Planctomycetota bacterium]